MCSIFVRYLNTNQCSEQFLSMRPLVDFSAEGIFEHLQTIIRINNLDT